MHAVLLDESRLYKEFRELYETESMHTLPLVTYVEPQAATFNLLNQNVSYCDMIIFHLLVMNNS